MTFIECCILFWNTKETVNTVIYSFGIGEVRLSWWQWQLSCSIKISEIELKITIEFLEKDKRITFIFLLWTMWASDTYWKIVFNGNLSGEGAITKDKKNVSVYRLIAIATIIRCAFLILIYMQVMANFY